MIRKHPESRHEIDILIIGCQGEAIWLEGLTENWNKDG